MRVNSIILDFIVVLALLVILMVGALKAKELLINSAKPPVCRCSAIQQIEQLRQETRQQYKQLSLAILNTAYPPECNDIYDNDYYIGSIEQQLGCHACHGGG